MIPQNLDLTTVPQWEIADVQQLLGEEMCLVVSSAAPDGGGLFAISRGQWETLDTIPSVGLALGEGRLARAVYSTLGEPTRPIDEIIWYDAYGMTRIERIDGTHSIHDLSFDPYDPDALIFVASETNSVYRHKPGRPLQALVHPGARGDGGHRNCLAHHSGLTYLTAFSTMANHREWNRGGNIDTGVLIEVETQRVVIEGLCRPHSPLRTASNDGWIIANSGIGELVWISDSGRRDTVVTGGWPQDIVRSGQHLIVAVCSRRGPLAIGPSDPNMEARLFFIDETLRSVAGVFTLPLKVVYDLLIAPEAMVNGLRVGTGTNALRLSDTSLRQSMALSRDIADDNGPEDHHGDVVVLRAPDTVVLGDDIVVTVRAVYRGTRRGKTFGDRAIRLGTKWIESEMESRHMFQSILIPHQVLEFDLVVECPPTTGVHTLKIGFLQELVAWFGNSANTTVTVVDDPIPSINIGSLDGTVGDRLVDSASRRERKISDVGTVRSWWHSVDIGDGVVTPGHKTSQLITREWDDLDLPPLAGKSVLDIGAWDGYFSFAAERHGATRVVAVDDFVWAVRWDRLHDVHSTLSDTGHARTRLREQMDLWDYENLPGKAGFDLCHRHLSSNVEAIVANYMDLDPLTVGTFDVVMYLGVLYHEPNPLASLEKVRTLTRGVAVVETSALFVPGCEGRALAEFYPSDELNGDATNWWSPNAAAACGMAHAAGFSRTRITKSHPPEWDALPGGSPPLLYRLMLHCYVD